jgi:hypothetical protein
MAGAGFKTFNTGDVLLASEVNTYLMQQTVMVFDDASARTTALGANVAEGMMSYLKDTNLTYRYDGSSWLSDAGTTSPLTTKGDLWTYSTTDARLAVGTDGYTLVADSAETTGLKWAAPASSSGPAFFAKRITSIQSLTTNVQTKIQFNGEEFDTDNCYDPTTNYRFTANKAGYYQFNAAVLMDGGSLTAGDIVFKKNGTNFSGGNLGPDDANGYLAVNASAVIYLNGSTDYVEVFVTAYGGAQVNYGNNTTNFSGVWIRS